MQLECNIEPKPTFTRSIISPSFRKQLGVQTCRKWHWRPRLFHPSLSYHLGILSLTSLISRGRSRERDRNSSEGCLNYRRNTTSVLFLASLIRCIILPWWDSHVYGVGFLLVCFFYVWFGCNVDTKLFEMNVFVYDIKRTFYQIKRITWWTTLEIISDTNFILMHIIFKDVKDIEPWLSEVF